MNLVARGMGSGVEGLACSGIELISRTDFKGAGAGEQLGGGGTMDKLGDQAALFPLIRSSLLLSNGLKQRIKATDKDE